MAKTRYDQVAMALHWVIAIAIIAMLISGAVMVEMPFGDQKFQLYQLHKSLGVTIIVATVLRLGWRLMNPPPPALPGPRWEKAAAAATHWAFYGLMIALPVSGWLMVSASPFNIPTNVWGLFELPHLPALADLPADAKPAAEGQLKSVHYFAGLAMAALFVLHVGAALRHAIVLRDGTLARMIPFLSMPSQKERDA